MRAAGLHDGRSRGGKSEVALDGEAADGMPQLWPHQRQRELLAVVYLQWQHAEGRASGTRVVLLSSARGASSRDCAMLSH